VRPAHGSAAPAAASAARAPAYLDYAATAPVDPRVAAAIGECLTHAALFGNPASRHYYGRLAHARVEQARAQAAALIGAAAAQLIRCDRIEQSGDTRHRARGKRARQASDHSTHRAQIGA
jgi:cysteine desulfurase